MTSPVSQQQDHEHTIYNVKEMRIIYAAQLKLRILKHQLSILICHWNYDLF